MQKSAILFLILLPKYDNRNQKSNMQYPLISEYVDSICSAEDNFDKLSGLRPVLDDNGNPVMSSGNFAVVFKMKDVNTGKMYAVKCFTREQIGRAESYKQISEYIKNMGRNSYLLSVNYYENELFVDTTQTTITEFPILLMEWVDGLGLDEYLKSINGDKYRREKLADSFQEFVLWLLPKPFAHGDLKPENIIVKSDGNIVLIDYDGMFVPSMAGQKAREAGTPFYRYKGVNICDFDEHIDDYAALLILLILKAMVINSESYYDDYITTCNIDFFHLFDNYIGNPNLAPYISLFLLVASYGKIDIQMIYTLLPNKSEKVKSKVSNLRNAVCKGDTSAMIELADYYLTEATPHNIDKALKYYELALRLGDVNASCGFCRCLNRDTDFSKDETVFLFNLLFSKGVDFAYCRKGSNLLGYDDSNGEILRTVADKGFPPAQLNLANRYSFKSKEKSKAIELYAKAAEQGYEVAISALVRYFKDKPDIAEIWFNSYNSKAQFKIGKMYYDGGWKIEQDYKEAIKWWTKSSEQGYAEAQFYLAICFNYGLGIAEDATQAVYWYEKAAEQGLAEAQTNLSFCYDEGYGVNRNIEKAVYWYKKAAKQGNMTAQYNLACYYYDGKSVLQNYEKAAYWFTKAAEQGYAEAQYNIGVCYANGKGIKQDKERAFYWFMKAAEQNISDAQFEIGYYYEKGTATKRNIAQAVYWYKKATEQGNSDAEYRLELCCKKYKIIDDIEVTTEEEIYQVYNNYSADGKRFLCYYTSQGIEYYIKEGTEILCNDSFNDLYNECDGNNLYILHLPSTLKRIGNNVFCASISNIISASDNFLVENHFLLSKDRKTLYRYFGENKIVNIPEGVKYIKGGAFSEENIENVIIPHSLVGIGDNPFVGCLELKEIISHSDRFKMINNALYDIREERLITVLNNIKIIRIKNGTRTISKHAFFGLQIQYIYLPETIIEVDEKIEKDIIQLVDKIIIAKKENKDTSGLEGEVDKIVYSLYGLSEEEIRIIEG